MQKDKDTYLMRIILDMQGVQTEGSRFRGIGRYALAHAQAIVRNRGEHEVDPGSEWVIPRHYRTDTSLLLMGCCRWRISSRLASSGSESWELTVVTIGERGAARANSRSFSRQSQP